LIMQKLRELFHILFIYDPAARLNLFVSFPFIRRFFRNRNNLAIVRSFGDVAFTCLILLGLFGSQDPGRNISLFLAWGVWWSGVVLSWFFLGKFWCGVCPFLGIGRLLQRFGLCLNLEPPHALRHYFIHVAVLLFAVIIWAESVTDMKHWPLGTALLLLSILLGATIMGFLYKGQAWCRYICPLGKIIGAGATMSMIELRSDLRLCRTCGSFSCKRGRGELRGCPVYLGAHNVKNSQDCLLCGRCVLLCENESPRLLLRNPFVELVADKGRDITFSFIVPFLAGSQWARFIQESPWYHPVQYRLFNSRGITFLLLLIVCFTVFLCIIKLGNHLMGRPHSDKADRSSPMIPILIPLAFSGELVYRLHYLLSEAGQFPAIVGRQFGFDLERFSFMVSAHALTSLSVTLLGLGGLGSMYAARLIRRRLKESSTSASSSVFILIGLVSFVYLLLVLF
jgi:hypothetical protein